MTTTVIFDEEDISDVIENVSKRYVIRTIDQQYLKQDKGSIIREGLGELSFDLSGRAYTLERIEELRKLFLENDDEYKPFYYPHDDKFWRIISAEYNEGEVAGQPNIYPFTVRLKTLDQFQYGSGTSSGTIITLGQGTITLTNDGDIWVEPDIEIYANEFFAIPYITDANGREIFLNYDEHTGRGRIEQGQTLYIYPNYTARIDNVWVSDLLCGIYPRIEAINGDNEDWFLRMDYGIYATFTFKYSPRWW